MKLVLDMKTLKDINATFSKCGNDKINIAVKGTQITFYTFKDKNCFIYKLNEGGVKDGLFTVNKETISAVCKMSRSNISITMYVNDNERLVIEVEGSRPIPVQNTIDEERFKVELNGDRKTLVDNVSPIDLVKSIRGANIFINKNHHIAELRAVLFDNRLDGLFVISSFSGHENFMTKLGDAKNSKDYASVNYSEATEIQNFFAREKDAVSIFKQGNILILSSATRTSYITLDIQYYPNTLDVRVNLDSVKANDGAYIEFTDKVKDIEEKESLANISGYEYIEEKAVDDLAEILNIPKDSDRMTGIIDKTFVYKNGPSIYTIPLIVFNRILRVIDTDELITRIIKVNEESYIWEFTSSDNDIRVVIGD